MIEVEVRRSEIRLYWLWVLAAVVGAVVYQLLEGLLVDLPVFAAPVQALSLAIPQWYVLRYKLKLPSFWAMMTFFGETVGLVLLFAANNSLTAVYARLDPNNVPVILTFFCSVQAIKGLVLGGFQWLALRDEVERANLWPWGVAGASVAMTLFNLTVMSAFMQTVSAANFLLFTDLRSVVAALVSAIFTGMLLVYLLRHPLAPQEPEPES